MSDQAALVLWSWLKLFALTQLVEVPIYAVAIHERPVWQRLCIGFAATTLTHPLFVLVLHRPLLLALGPVAALAVGEAIVIAIEGLWLRAFGVEHPWHWALVANASSVAVGMTLSALLRGSW